MEKETCQLKVWTDIIDPQEITDYKGITEFDID